MTKSIEVPQEFLPYHAVNSRQWLYMVLAVLANATLWAAAILVLKLSSPSYSSKFAVALPSTASTTNVNLPNIGAASYENYSPFTASTQDPRENYKLIANSETVLDAAAGALSMSDKEFGEPRIKNVTNTSLMEFELKGTSPQEAQNKAWAVYRALQARLTQLRAQEVVQRDGSFQSGLGSAQIKLEIAQKRLSDYKARSGLNSDVQIRSFAENIEQLRRQRAEALAQQQQAAARLAQLSGGLGTSTQRATAAFALKSDQLFQQLLKNYSDASSQVSVLSAQFQPNHPQVRTEQAKQQAAQKALLQRGQALLGRAVDLGTLRQLNLSNTTDSSAQEQLLQEVVEVQSQQRGYQAQAQELEKQIEQQQARLRVLAQQETTLDALKRDLQIAEAVFSSTLARLDIGRSNMTGSYPLLQLLYEPTFPKKPSSPQPLLVLLGTILGSLFITTGIIFLARQQRQSAERLELE